MESNPKPTLPGPRKRRGLVVVVAILLVLIAVLFVGLNLSHMKETKEGEVLGNGSGVPGPHRPENGS